MQLTDTNRKIDSFEAYLALNFERIECPVTDRFTDGMYIRQIFMPKGANVVSKIHKTKHPFVILKGDVTVFSENEGVVRYKAPMFGITKPGTRRALVVNEDTIWITFHPAQENNVDDIENRIIEPHINPMLAQEALINLLSQ